MQLEGDFYSVTVAEKRDSGGEVALWHNHLFETFLPPGTPKKAAVEFFNDFCKKFPEPKFRVALHEHIRRCVVRKDSSAKSK